MCHFPHLEQVTDHVWQRKWKGMTELSRKHSSQWIKGSGKILECLMGSFLSLSIPDAAAGVVCITDVSQGSGDDDEISREQDHRAPHSAR